MVEDRADLLSLLLPLFVSDSNELCIAMRFGNGKGILLCCLLLPTLLCKA